MKTNPKRFPEDFSGLTMGVNAGFLLSDQLMQAARSGKVKIEEASNNESNLHKLASHHVDCYVSDRGAALYSAKKLRSEDKSYNLELQEAATLSTEDTYVGYSAFANPPYKADFIHKVNEEILEMKRDGSMEKIINHYLH